MKSFIQYLSESTLNVHQFPHLMSKYGAALTHLFQLMNPVIEEGQLGKDEYDQIRKSAEGLFATFNEEMKDTYITNDAWFKTPPGQRKADHPSYEDDYMWDILNTTIPVAHMNGRVKKANKTPDTPLKRAYLPAAKELAAIADSVLALKSKIVVVKKKTKAELAAHAAFTAPPSTKNAKAHVSRAMKEMTDQILPKYIDQLYTKWVTDLSEFFLKDDEERRIHLGIDLKSERDRAERNAAARKQHGAYARLVQRQPHYLDSLLGMIAAPRPSAEGIVFTPHNDWKGMLHKHATAIAEDMQNQFVSKNVEKLASIVERKGNISGDPHVLSIQTDRGNVVGEMKFHFNDGSSFVVRNKVVSQFRYTNSGVSSFYQFPTTFHDAVLPNGHRMVGMPSEEQMNNIFATAS